METIIATAISAAVTLMVCILTNHAQNEKSRALLEFKMDELIRRQDKYNNVIERVYILERNTEVQEQKIKVADNRIADLERKVS